MTFERLLVDARGCVIDALGRLGIDAPEFAVEISPKREFGDVSCNVAFMLSGALRKAPRDIARDIAGACSPGALIERIDAHDSGHVNFVANWALLCSSVIESSQDDDVIPDVGGGAHVTIEHTSVNPNKPLHIGHIRNIIIGDALARILSRTNHAVSVLNYIDDLGLQVAELVLGMTQLGLAESCEDKKYDHHCGEIYVQARAQIDADSKLETDARGILARMEDHASSEAETARRVSQRVLDAQLETCWRIGASYDCINYESHILLSGMWDDIFKKLAESSLITHAESGDNTGCWIVPASHDKDNDKVLVRSNGTATYMAKDIPYAAWKLGQVGDPFGYAEYKPSGQSRKLYATTLDSSSSEPARYSSARVITVIDSRQTRLQTIITSLLHRFFGTRKDAYVHLAYESVTLSSETASSLGVKTDGKNVQMSGRSGTYVNADDVLDMLAGRAREETQKRNPDIAESDLADISEQIAVGTIRYEMIRQDLDKVITFDLARSLRLDGNTSSYMQYSHARAKRILQKAPDVDASPDYAALDGEHERALVRSIGTLGIALRDSAANLSPKVVARYSYELTASFNAFYEHVRVISEKDEADAVSARLRLVETFIGTLERALDTLGIPLPGKM